MLYTFAAKEGSGTRLAVPRHMWGGLAWADIAGLEGWVAGQPQYNKPNA